MVTFQKKLRRNAFTQWITPLAPHDDAEYHESVIARAQSEAIAIGGTGVSPVCWNDGQDARPTENEIASSFHSSQ
jgi:hypothetical protein